MKLHHQILYILIILSIFTGCEKIIISTRIEGTIIDKDTGEPIEGATVKASNGGFSYAGIEPEDSYITTTDVNGHFKLKFRAKKDCEYSLCSWKEPIYPACDPVAFEEFYFCYSLYCYDNEIKEGKKNEVVIEMEKYDYSE